MPGAENSPDGNPPRPLDPARRRPHPAEPQLSGHFVCPTRHAWERQPRSVALCCSNQPRLSLPDRNSPHLLSPFSRHLSHPEVRGYMASSKALKNLQRLGTCAVRQHMQHPPRHSPRPPPSLLLSSDLPPLICDASSNRLSALHRSAKPWSRCGTRGAGSWTGSGCARRRRRCCRPRACAGPS